MQETQVFWMVWNSAQITEPVEHSSRQAAEDAARRLAACTTGLSFYVLESATGFCAKATPAAPVMLFTPAEEDTPPYQPF